MWLGFRSTLHVAKSTHVVRWSPKPATSGASPKAPPSKLKPNKAKKAKNGKRIPEETDVLAVVGWKRTGPLQVMKDKTELSSWPSKEWKHGMAIPRASKLNGLPWPFCQKLLSSSHKKKQRMNKSSKDYNGAEEHVDFMKPWPTAFANSGLGTLIAGAKPAPPLSLSGNPNMSWLPWKYDQSSPRTGSLSWMSIHGTRINRPCLAVATPKKTFGTRAVIRVDARRRVKAAAIATLPFIERSADTNYVFLARLPVLSVTKDELVTGIGDLIAAATSRLWYKPTKGMSGHLKSPNDREKQQKSYRRDVKSPV